MGIVLADLAQLTLTSGGTRQAISATALPVESVIITAASTNNAAGVFIGAVTVSSTRFIKKLAPGESWSMAIDVSDQGDSSFIQLSAIYWDGTTGDKINVGYMQRS